MNRKRQPMALDGYVRDTSHRPGFSKGPVLVFLGLIVFGLLAVPLLQENGVGAWLRLQDEEKELSAKVDGLEKANIDLEQSLDAIENDPVTLEKLAREEFNMHLLGEKVVLVRDEKPNQE